MAHVLNTTGVSTFGGRYDNNLSFGVKYDADQEFTTENERFEKKINKEEFPTWEQDGWLKGRKRYAFCH